MSDPILSREEAFKLAQRFEATEDNDNIPGVVALTPLELEQFLSAVLEKVCGEPVAWRAPNFSGSGEQWAYLDADDRFETVRGEPTGEPLYALTRETKRD
ncbi:hypothetical protein [Burkholderia vietnamiensis]|uniref:hypothetical protein n=1 Tax=Burkholderia vietnamiensis TaxID=60552 RepID=UPI0015934B55|nr:hypothetical protein [Burkholderia vietnamiensis]